MALNVPRLHGPNDDFKADTGFIGERGKNMNRKEMSLSGSGVGWIWELPERSYPAER
jgi:hypothetical protein